MLDASFLVATVLVVITLLFYILYWGRFLALLIGLVFRVVLWNRGGSSAWIQIGSFHVSLLAGRILLKDFRYHSSNQTFKIVKSHGDGEGRSLAMSPGHRAAASTRHLKASNGLSTIGRLPLTISSHGWKQTYPSQNVAPKVLVQIGPSPN
ncbi:hypothetical protein BJV77DRAFT_383016 [Russula vinacea]|nr:hypothetical protein BJV77DRAFT_383016 [Russula vinacea]